MKKETILNLSSLPIKGMSYPKPPNHFVNREYLNIYYETDPDLLRSVVPEPLEPESAQIIFEVMKMPDSSGFGSYTESGLVIPCIYKGEKVNFPLMMFLDDEPPISGGREIWGFPKKYGHPQLKVIHDTLVGTVDYAGERIATATMTYKHQNLMDQAEHIAASLGKKQINLKIIPCVSGGLAIAQLVSFSMINVVVKGAWAGDARLHLIPHINAPLADFPVKNIIGASHYIADMTLPYGKIEHDYLG
ncbi:MAG: acetoacetate decarboxylase [Alphaproteobacteria bacterium]